MRATFRLSNQMIDLLKIAANHLGVQQKALIDELVSNRETLDRVAGESRHNQRAEAERRQKTFVLSRSTLDLLDEISSEQKLSRDHLVERCISRLIPFVDAEQKKHRQRRLLLKEVERYLAEGNELLRKADQLLEPDDRFRLKLEKIVAATERNVNELRRFVKRKESLSY